MFPVPCSFDIPERPAIFYGKNGCGMEVWGERKVWARRGKLDRGKGCIQLEVNKNFKIKMRIEI